MSKSKDPDQLARRDAAQDGAEDGLSIPSTLDPNLDVEAIDSDMAIDGLPDRRPGPREDIGDEPMNPEDEIFERVEDAAESIPADMPADKADQTDRREERPPGRGEV
ncbi:hypothetical protein CURE108131_08715 [Cupriavidus respiraculi]|uniref:Serine kinase/phosphatase n=1 Tax=Cupriavidus respiraculi TaxID=195930 RepID=A0ABM8WM75_9BURK|nr:hypothetical protein [Cupriavidus respiraculi]MBY4947447.1 hypothetical protein [Cupriavidus respiraculi]CAG9168481.1 hypothetical protein LMG21510_01092 [Cupriavidus respiraculi]